MNAQDELDEPVQEDSNEFDQEQNNSNQGHEDEIEATKSFDKAYGKLI